MALIECKKKLSIWFSRVVNALFQASVPQKLASCIAKTHIYFVVVCDDSDDEKSYFVNFLANVSHVQLTASAVSRENVYATGILNETERPLRTKHKSELARTGSFVVSLEEIDTIVHHLAGEGISVRDKVAVFFTRISSTIEEHVLARNEKRVLQTTFASRVWSRQLLHVMSP